MPSSTVNWVGVIRFLLFCFIDEFSPLFGFKLGYWVGGGGKQVMGVYSLPIIIK